MWGTGCNLQALAFYILRVGGGVETLSHTHTPGVYFSSFPGSRIVPHARCVVCQWFFTEFWRLRRLQRGQDKVKSQERKR